MSADYSTHTEHDAGTSACLDTFAAYQSRRRYAAEWRAVAAAVRERRA